MADPKDEPEREDLDAKRDEPERDEPEPGNPLAKTSSGDADSITDS
jgi:hypothetical protein